MLSMFKSSSAAKGLIDMKHVFKNSIKTDTTYIAVCHKALYFSILHKMLSTGKKGVNAIYVDMF